MIRPTHIRRYNLNVFTKRASQSICKNDLASLASMAFFLREKIEKKLINCCLKLQHFCYSLAVKHFFLQFHQRLCKQVFSETKKTKDTCIKFGFNNNFSQIKRAEVILNLGVQFLFPTVKYFSGVVTKNFKFSSRP